MTPVLELALLDSGTKDYLSVYARLGDDTACMLVDSPAKLSELADFADRFQKAVDGEAQIIDRAEMREFGTKLFETVIRDAVADLYSAIPKTTPIRLQIFSNHAGVQRLPWEIMQHPDGTPVPDRNRMVVRVVSTVGVRPLGSLPRGARLNVLFAVAEPLDQTSTDWNGMYVVLKNKFDKRVSKQNVELRFMRATTREGLSSKLTERFDVLHFHGHGEVIKGTGNLVFVDEAGKSDYVPAQQLATLLAGTSVRLVILSACQSAMGSFKNDFTVLAKGLVKAGIPAVVANQAKVSVQTIAPFAATLYDKLLESGDVDYAVAEARAREGRRTIKRQAKCRRRHSPSLGI
jgi:CHAT domain